MNHILQSSLSPTQEKTPQYKSKTIHGSLIDDEDNIFQVAIDLDYTDYYGWDKWEISVWGFDFKIIDGTPVMSNRDLHETIKDIIVTDSDVHVTFY